MPNLTIFPKSLDDETRNALFDLWRIHLTSEFSNAQLEYWVWRSPSPETLLAFTYERAKRADRANELLQIAEEAGMPDAVEIADRARFDGAGAIPHRLKIFTFPVESYIEAIVYRWLYNHTVSCQSMQFFGGCYVPYESWAFRHYMEVGMETFPTKRSTALRDLVQELFLPTRRDEVQALVDKWLPRFDACFGHPGSNNEGRYLRLLIKTYPNYVPRRVFRQAVQSDLNHLKLRALEGGKVTA